MAKAGVFGAKVTGLVEGTALQTTAHSRGCGWTTRQVRLEETHGQRHGIESTVYGWKVLRLIEAVTKMPLAVTVGQMRAHEVLWARAWVTQARRNRTGAARLAGVVFDRGCWDGPTLWWLDQQGLRCVGPAKTTRAVPAAARAQAAADAGISIGRRVQTIRPGQGKTAWTARQATEVGG